MNRREVLAILGSLAACAGPPPAANVNLNGFPIAFQRGYADGCASGRGGRVRDEQRFLQDLQYAQGWRDGFDVCRRR